MADPVTYDSELSVLKLTDTGTTLRDISDYVVNIIPRFGRKMNDAITLGHDHEQPTPGTRMTSLDVELVYSEDALVGTDTVLGPLLEDTTARTWEYYPRGVTGVKYSGSGFIENYQPGTRIGNLVSATFTLRSRSRTRTAP